MGKEKKKKDKADKERQYMPTTHKEKSLRACTTCRLVLTDV